MDRPKVPHATPVDIKGRCFIQERTHGRIVVCLQDVMGAVVGMELSAERAWEFVEGLDAGLGE